MNQSKSKGPDIVTKQVKHETMRVLEQVKWRNEYLDGRTADEWVQWGSALNWLYKSI